MPTPIDIPAQVILGDALGDNKDSVEVFIDGQRIKIFEDYDVQMSVLQQPAAFTLRLGWSDVAADLLNLAIPGKPFELRINKVTIQSGRIDGRRASGSSSGTFVEVKGRDWMAAVYDGFVQEERSFAEKTYFELTRTILDICGLKDRYLFVVNGNESAAFKKAITGTQVIKVVNEEVVKEVETGAATSTSKVVNKTLKARLGERWFDWLQRQYKLAGLFLWCSGEGNFYLGTPDWQQEPAFTVLRSRGIDTEFATVVDFDWNDDTTSRHSEIVVYGRGGGGAAGRAKVSGRYADAEMASRGLDKKLVVHDDDCKNDAQCEYVARRMAAEERRAGWTLKYTVSGHTMPSLKGSGVAIWNPDLTCRVSDDEIPIEGTFYVEAVGYSRKPDTTTSITLMRPEDLVFAKEEQKNRKPPALRRRPKG